MVREYEIGTPLETIKGVSISDPKVFWGLEIDFRVGADTLFIQNKYKVSSGEVKEGGSLIVSILSIDDLISALYRIRNSRPLAPYLDLMRYKK